MGSVIGLVRKQGSTTTTVTLTREYDYGDSGLFVLPCLRTTLIEQRVYDYRESGDRSLTERVGRASRWAPFSEVSYCQGTNAKLFVKDGCSQGLCYVEYFIWVIIIFGPHAPFDCPVKPYLWAQRRLQAVSLLFQIRFDSPFYPNRGCPSG